MGHRILVAVDGTDASERALEYAAKLVRDLKDGELKIFNVGEPIPINVMEYDKLPGEGTWEEKLEHHREEVDEYEKAEERDQKEMFAHLKHRAEQLGVQPEHISTGFTADMANIHTEILMEAEKGGYEAICVGKHSRSAFKDYLLGSVSERIVRHAKGCAVWVVE